MKILILEDIADPTKGGAENSMFHFIKCLNLCNHQVTLVCSEFAYPKDLKFSRVEILNLKSLQFRSSLSFFNNVRKLRRIIIDEKIEFVLTHTIHNFTTLRIAKIGLQFQTAVIFKWIYNSKNIGIKARWGLKSIDKAVFLNEFVKDYWSRQFVLNRIESIIIPAGITIDRKDMPLINRFKNYLYVGRITEGKGLKILISAFELIEGDNLIIVGEFNPLNNEYHYELQELVKTKQLDQKVKFHGKKELSEIFDFYDKADMIIIPSILPEAQPLVFVESVMRSKLCICSNIGGIKEMCQDSFLFFKPNCPIAIANKIRELENMEKEILANRFSSLREMLLNKYDKENTQLSTIQFLFEV